MMDEEERKAYINVLLNLRMPNGKTIDIFKLHGVLYVGNCEDGEWNLRENHMQFAASHLPIHISEFDWCFEYGDDLEINIKERFSELLRNAAEGHII